MKHNYSKPLNPQQNPVDFADAFRYVEPWLSPVLASTRYKAKIKQISGTFPPLSWAAMECRLAGDDTRVDFMLSLDKQELREFLLAERSELPLWANKRKHFLQEADHNPFLAGFLDCIWLEFDLEPLHETLIPEPLFFAVFKPWPYDYGLLSAILGNLLPLAKEIKGDVRDTLARCINKLDPMISLYAIGFLESREPDLLRVVLKTEQLTGLWAFLDKINWPGDLGELRTQLSTLPELADSFLFHLNVGTEVLPQLGLELCLNASDREGKLARVLDPLIQAGRCNPEKKNAVLECQGTSHGEGGVLPKAEWQRYVNYVKLNYVPGRKLEAKTYLFYRKNGTL